MLKHVSMHADDGHAMEAFWCHPESAVFAALASTARGLTVQEAQDRIRSYGPNSVSEQIDLSALRLLIRQFASPLVLILLIAASISLSLREWVDASVILAIILGSTLLGFSQEFRASRALAELKQRLALNVRVLRSGIEVTVPASTLVPGDIALLAAGNLVPADGLIITSSDLLVSEANLTGESFPVEKRPGLVTAEASVSARTNSVFLGSSVRSGTARILIVATGHRTAFGAIASRLEAHEPETEFERGIRQFGALIVRIMFLIVLAVLIANQVIGRPFADSLLFSLALAVGLSPELLPAIVSVTLSTGARHLAKGGVIVRRLVAIENLGSIDILCTDKTGTLSTGEIVLEGVIGPDGKPSERARHAAYLNAALETGIENPLDVAIVAFGKSSDLSVGEWRKLAEIPYDFVRRRLTIIVERPAEPLRHRLICKGAFAEVLAICTAVESGGKCRPLTAARRKAIERLFQDRSEAGYRVLAVAEREFAAKSGYSRDDESELVLTGLLLFLDPPKPQAQATLHDLAALGIGVKIISGDNRYVTAHLAQTVGLDPGALVTGSQIAAMSDEALWHTVSRTTLFVEIDPQQKERIVRSFQHIGHAVGYLGDGINDAPALRAADVGISVDHAVDVARESSDVILLRHDLDVLRQGIVDGRRAFANTLKYISITTSANFGNMISMALATPFLPFLPLLPKQILLNNFLSDLPSVAISSDNVDRAQIRSPQRWNVAMLQRFMVVFGLISSCFDLMTFALLLLLLKSNEAAFQTGWFVVSLLTELAVVLVLRTHGSAFTSRPSRLLAVTTVAVAVAGLCIPFLGPVATLFGFAPLSAAATAAALAIVGGYIVATEYAKRAFYRHRMNQPERRTRRRSPRLTTVNPA
jgi:Mg2+-importing ATPase